MKNTTLWHVGITKYNDSDSLRCVCVSDEPADFYFYGSHMRIRTITANAAGRKFIRGNLIAILSRLEESYSDNPIGLCEEWMGFGINSVPIVRQLHKLV